MPRVISICLFPLILSLAGCVPSGSSTAEANKDLVRRFTSAVNRGELALLDDIVAVDFVRHSQATPGVEVRSLEEMKRFDEENRAIFPDQHVTIDQLVAEGDRVAFWGTYSGTQQGALGDFPPSGKRIDSEMAGIFRIQDGKIAELWITWDNVALLSQLGYFPPPGPAENGG